MSLEKSVQPRRINHVGAANKGENQVRASEQGFQRRVCDQIVRV